MITPRARKRLLLPAGVLAVGFGIAGAFVPLVPTTPFLLLAAACFARSSDRHYEWLMNHRWLGAHVKNYREHKATTKRVKAVSLALLWGSIGYAAIVVADGWAVRALLLCVAVGVTIHVLSLRLVTGDTTPEAAATDDGRVAEVTAMCPKRAEGGIRHACLAHDLNRDPKPVLRAAGRRRRSRRPSRSSRGTRCASRAPSGRRRGSATSTAGRGGIDVTLGWTGTSSTAGTASGGSTTEVGWPDPRPS